jgi:hypothetical protein
VTGSHEKWSFKINKSKLSLHMVKQYIVEAILIEICLRNKKIYVMSSSRCPKVQLSAHKRQLVHVLSHMNQVHIHHYDSNSDPFVVQPIVSHLWP